LCERRAIDARLTPEYGYLTQGRPGIRFPFGQWLVASRAGLAGGHFSVIDADLWEMGKAAAALCRTPALMLRFCESSEIHSARMAKARISWPRKAAAEVIA
jgi:hypothetical protein